MHRAVLAVAVLTVGFASAGCSSTATQTEHAPAPVVASSSAAPASQSSLDAKAVTERLAKAIPSVKLTVVYDGSTDPNGRLGRQGQYTSKTAFDDSRVSSSTQAAQDAVQGRRDSISYGGTVEVFANEQDATSWASFVEGASKALSGLTAPDYLYRHGNVVVRVSHLLTADQAAEYQKALG